MPKDLPPGVQMQQATSPTFNGHKGGGRPSVHRPSVEPPVFYTTIKIFAIPSIDDKRQTFDAHFRLFVEWRDETLPSGDKRWPKLKILNQVAQSSMRNPDEDREPEKNMDTGWWELKRDFIGTFSADFDMHVFPFDNQDLTVQVRVSYTLGKAMDETGTSFPAELRQGKDRPGKPTGKKGEDIFQFHSGSVSHTKEWEFEDCNVGFHLEGKTQSESRKKRDWRDAHWTVRASRQYESYVANVFFIMLLMQLLGFGTHFIAIGSEPHPRDASEQGPSPHIEPRINVVLTLLLTSVAFKVSIAEQIPKMPYLTLIDKYLLCSFTTLFVIALEIFMLDTVADHLGVSREGCDVVAFQIIFGAWAAVQLLFAVRFVREARTGGKLHEPKICMFNSERHLSSHQRKGGAAGAVSRSAALGYQPHTDDAPASSAAAGGDAGGSSQLAASNVGSV